MPALGFNSTLEVLVAQTGMVAIILTYSFVNLVRKRKLVESAL